MSEQDSLFDKTGTEPSSPSSGSLPGQPAEASSLRASGDLDMAARLKRAERDLSNLMVFLLVIGGTLAVFLLQQVRYTKADLTLLQAQGAALNDPEAAITKFSTETYPAQVKFLQQLGEYAKVHPDIIPILDRHGLLQRAPVDPNAQPAAGP